MRQSMQLEMTAPAPSYDLLRDRSMVGIYEPEFGYGNLAAYGLNGALGSIGLNVPIAGSFDGLPAYQCRGKTGTTGYLRTAGTTSQLQPLTMIVGGRWGAASTINTQMAGGGPGGQIMWWSATQISLNGGGAQVTTTPGNFHIYEVTYQSDWSYLNIDAAAAVRLNPGIGGAHSGFFIGAGFAGANPSDCDVLCAYIVAGQISAQTRAAIYARIKSRRPTTFTLPATIGAAGAPIATLTPSPLWDPTQPWDIVCNPFSQSNFMNAATDNATSAGAAGTFLLGNDYVWKVFGNPAGGFNWLSGTNQVDPIASSPFSGKGNIAGRMLNDMHTASGRPTVFIPMAQSASAIVPGTTGVANDWNPYIPRNNNLRDSLYWASVFRAQEGIRWGGTIRKIMPYQGNTEAQNSSLFIRQAWPDSMHKIIRRWCRDVGIPNPYDNLGSSVCKTVIVQLEPGGAPTAQYTDFRNNIQPLILQNANQVFLLNNFAGTYEADNVHIRSVMAENIGAAGAAA